VGGWEAEVPGRRQKCDYCVWACPSRLLLPNLKLLQCVSWVYTVNFTPLWGCTPPTARSIHHTGPTAHLILNSLCSRVFPFPV